MKIGKKKLKIMEKVDGLLNIIKVLVQVLPAKQRNIFQILDDIKLIFVGVEKRIMKILI
jgi:hypothetical protein